MAAHQQRGRKAKCANCHQRPGTIRWGNTLALTHGWAQMWCEICATEAQLEHAQERAAVIPELEAKLGALRREDPEATTGTATSELRHLRTALEKIALHEVRENEPTPCDWHCTAMMVAIAREALSATKSAELSE
jgi:hypothetical protein